MLNYKIHHKKIIEIVLKVQFMNSMSNLIQISKKKFYMKTGFIPFNIINRRQIINCPIMPIIRHIKIKKTETSNKLDNHSINIHTEPVQDILPSVIIPRTCDADSCNNRNKTQLLILFMIILRAISNYSSRKVVCHSSSSTLSEIISISLINLLLNSKKVSSLSGLSGSSFVNQIASLAPLCLLPSG